MRAQERVAGLSALVGLAWARLRYRPLGRLLVVLGVAVATVLPVVAQASASVAATRAVAHGIAGLPAGQRTLIVSTSSGQQTPDGLAALDRAARQALGQLSTGAVRRELLYRQLADKHGGTFLLGATDDLAGAVRLTAGRMPASCIPTRCEVVVVGSGTPDLDASLGLVVVGRAVRTDPLLLTGTFDPGHDAPLLLVDGVDGAQRLAALTLFQRAFGWVTPVDLALVRSLGVDGYTERSAQVADALSVSRTGLLLTAPDVVLRQENDRAQLSARRFALLSGSATALLLGFAVVAAIGLRRDQLAVERLLRRRGARRSGLLVLSVVEAVVPVVVGTLLGLLAGAGAAALVARLADAVGVAGVAGDAVRAALPAVAVGAVLATVAVAVTASVPTPAASSRTAWRIVDAVIVVGLATVGLALARGTVGTAALTGGTDPLLAALPVVGVICGGLLAARLWPSLATWAGRVLPRRRLGGRLGLLGAVRHPLRAVATTAFVAAAVAVVVFTGSYRATLQQGAVDQAAFAVPLDARLTVGTTLDRPLDVASPATMAAAAPGTQVRPVVRSSAAIRVSSNEASPVELLGVDPDALTEVASWSHVAGGLDPETAAGLLRTTTAPTGLVVPPGATTLRLPASGSVDPVQFTTWVRLADGVDVGVPMARSGGGFVGALRADLAGGRVFAFTLAEDPGYATRHQHAIGEGLTDRNVLGGEMVLAAPEFSAGSGTGQQTLTNAWTGWGSDTTQTAVASGGTSLTVRYEFTGARLVVRSDAAAALPTLAVLVDPGTAARATNGHLELGTGVDGPPLEVQVAGVLPRFPTVGGSFVLTDQAALARALDDREPGTGAVAEVWLASASPQALGDALGAAPYDRLTVALRADEQQRLATDPLAEGASSLLLWGAVLALAVAVVAVALLVVGERRDDAAELYAWEGDGVRAATLRRSLLVRAVSVVVVGVPAGLLVGLLLSQVTAALVTVTAVGTSATPPLVLAVGPGWLAAVLGGALVVAVAAAAVVAATALREAMPVPPETDLR